MQHEPPQPEERPAGRRADDVESARSSLGHGNELDASIRSEMEQSFGRSFADVRVHTDTHAAEQASALSARAFTIGTDIAFASGDYRPGTAEGDAIIAHELAHVVQQEGASARRTEGVEPARSPLEHDADRATAHVLAGRPAPELRRSGGLRLQRCSSTPSYKTSSGEFKIANYKPFEAGSGDVAKSTGADIDIWFTPFDTILSDKIAFVQVIQMLKSGSPYYLFEHARQRGTTAAEGEAGWWLDRVDNRKYPTYSTEDTGTEGSFTTFGYRKSATDYRTAWMQDKPRLNRAAGQTVSFTAISFATDMTHNAYLGGLRWGFEVSSGGTVSTMTPSVFAMGSPTGIQKRAIERWNQQAKDPDAAKRNAPDQVEAPAP